MSPPMFENKLYATLLYVIPEKVYVTYLMSPRGDIRKKGGDIKKNLCPPPLNIFALNQGGYLWRQSKNIFLHGN